MTTSRKFTIVFAVVTMGGLAGIIGWGEMMTPASQPQSDAKLVAQPSAASVTKTYREPTPQEVAEAQQAATNFVLGQKLVKQFYFVHDNGGSKVEQCVAVMAIRLHAQQIGDAQLYSQWTYQNAQELVYERDARKVGVDPLAKHHTKAEDEKLDPILRNVVDCQ